MSPPPSKDTPGFLFTPDSLAQKLVQESDGTFSGYWHHQMQGQAPHQVSKDWYLVVLSGRAVFADSQPPTVGGLFAAIERYVLRLKSQEARQIIESLQQKLVAHGNEPQLEALPVLLHSCYDLNLVRPEEVKKALRLKLLEDLDDILFHYSGRAQFLARQDFAYQVPTAGIDLNDLMAEARRRRLMWDQVKTYLPSVDSTLMLNEAAIRQAHLPTQQEQHLRMLVAQGRTVRTMAVALAQDMLDIARGVAQLLDKGLLTLEPLAKPTEPEIFIIDDSPLMLQQFKILVSSWGYRVRSFADPTSALSMMTGAHPIAIFLDINMPELSGFDLLKQIRRQPHLAQVPLVMLTGEKTLSNNWRAQWSGCQFLTKPLAPEEIPQFKQTLRTLLESMVA